MEIVGYVGAFLLAVCALPQMIMAIRQGHAKGISSLFLGSWYLGELLMLVFLIGTGITSGPLYWNYFINFIMLTVIVGYKIWGKE